jgi:acetyl-CoA acetyltransferase
VPSRTNALDGKVALAGVGYSQIARSTGRSEGSLAVEACKNALADAGLTIDDVDGISVWPDRISSAFEGPSIAYMHRALGMRNTRFWQAYGAGPAQLSSIVGAAYAIVAGAASTVVCFRAHLRQEQRFYVAGGTGASGNRATGDQAFKAPYGVPAGAPRFALWAQRQAHEFGVSDEDRGELVLLAREHAQLNPRAVWHGSPLTMDDYLSSDLISSPLRILDCDMPVDGAVAVVLTQAERAPDLRAAPAIIRSMGHATGPTIDFDIWPDMTHMGSRYAAEQLWAGTDLKPADVDVAQVYDGFSTLALAWLQDMGFVDQRDVGDWLREGNGRLGSAMPICTDGGQLGGGRLHGFGKVAEAVQQLRGECGPRQVPGAEVSLVCAGGGPMATTFLLTK